MGKLPKQSPGILVRKIGQEAMLYDINRGMVHILNAVAETIWSCCDGNTGINEMGQKLKESYSITQAHDVKKDIKEILSNFSELDLLCTDHEDYS